MTKDKKDKKDSKKNKKYRVEFASQEALKFHSRLEDLFLSLVLDVQAWISDSSTILDFLSDNDLRYAKGPGKKPGCLVFRRCIPVRINLLEEGDEALSREWEYEEVEERGRDHTAEILHRAKFYFGVDIGPVFEETFPIIFQYISEHLTPARRGSLEPAGWVGRRYQKYLTSPTRIKTTYWPTSPGYLFRVDEYADGHCVTFQKKRQGRSAYQKLFSSECFDTSVMRPQLDAWLKSQGALPMNPWGRDDPRNIEKGERWTQKNNEDGSVTLGRKDGGEE